MKQISFSECKVIDQHILKIPLIDNELFDAFPFDFVPEMPLAAPEPSIVAAVSLDNDYTYYLLYSLPKEALYVYQPLGVDTERAVSAFLSELKTEVRDKAMREW